jgi:hypothetical protein
MKSKLLLSASFITLSFFSVAQNRGLTYAITGKINNAFLWADIRQVDLATGKVVKTLFEADKTPFKLTTEDQASGVIKKPTVNPTGMGVAACALDPLHNRLYFSPIHYSDILYLDLNLPDANFTTIKTKVIPSSSNESYTPEEDQISRMVFAADGYGYALSNDANHLIRFSTGKKSIVEDLGMVIDAPDNKSISVHNKCTSWGGDMVADAFGKLVLVSANHNVFFVDVSTKMASFKGSISGLPANFSTNGAAVDDDGNIVVSSANVFEGLYKVNLKDFSAAKVVSTDAPFNASDLANGNFLYQKQANAANSNSLTKSQVPLTTIGDTKIFPNPVTGSEFKVIFEGQKPGVYTLLLTDLAGRTVQTKVISISKTGQTATIRLTNWHTKGTYFVNVLNGNKQIAFSDKLVIE